MKRALIVIILGAREERTHLDSRRSSRGGETGGSSVFERKVREWRNPKTRKFIFFTG